MCQERNELIQSLRLDQNNTEQATEQAVVPPKPSMLSFFNAQICGTHITLVSPGEQANGGVNSLSPANP